MLLELDTPMLPVALAELPPSKNLGKVGQPSTERLVTPTDNPKHGCPTLPKFIGPQKLEELAVKRPIVCLAPEVPSELVNTPEQQNIGDSKLTIEKDPKFLGLKASRWTTAALGMAAIDLVFRDPILMSIGVIGGLTKLAYPHLKKVGGNKRKLHLAMVGGVATVTAMGLHLQISSAQALFFEEAESFLSTTFDLSGEAVATIFNVFRAVYVVYLIYSAISIWTAYNRDEDWMSVAKAPIVIFVGGTLIDAVTTIITT